MEDKNNATIEEREVVDTERLESVEPENAEVVKELNVDELEGVDTAEFVNEDNYNTFKLLGLKSKMNDIQTIVSNIETEQKKLIGENDEFDPIDNILKNYTEDQIKDMSIDEIDEILINEDGTPVEFTIDFGDDTKRFNQFKKDFLVMRKQALETISNFEEELNKINQEIAESQEEFDKAVSEFGNISALIRRKLEERLAAATDDEHRDLYTKLIVSFNNGLDLENVKSFCRGYKGRDIVSNFLNDKKSMYVYRSYLKVARSLNIKTDLTSFVGLEKKFLDEKYHKRPNIFVFAVISFIASLNNKKFTRAEGLFVTQFTINLKNLFYDKFDTPEDKETFINNIKEIIEIIG